MAALLSPAQPELSEEERRRLTWTSEREHRGTKKDLKPWKKRHRRPQDERERGGGRSPSGRRAKQGENEYKENPGGGANSKRKRGH